MAITNGEIQYYIDKMATFGGNAQGGVTRRLYDENWLEAVGYLKSQLESKGFEASFDASGNLFGAVEGENPEEIILTGSHIDTVKNGGRLDGTLGVLAAFLAIKDLYEEYGKPKRTLKLVAFCEEEGSRFPYSFWGSRSLVGSAGKEDAQTMVDEDGVSFDEAIHKAGFDYPEGPSMDMDRVKAFLELHIEQGGVLAREGHSIGIVTAIVGQKRYVVTLKGEANHAGTTPMGYRKDTNYAFARICVESTEKALQEGDPLVLTFGQVFSKPNAFNVVAGETVFTVDCRTTDKDQLDRFTDAMKKDMARIADEMGISLQLEVWSDEAPTPMDEGLAGIIEASCRSQGVSYKRMPSGAGHDSQILADFVPTAMIFVPSIGGISHSPFENTDTDDIRSGIEVLKGALYKLAYEK